MIGDDEAWAAVKRRDRAFDGRFVTGVLSTGIYCRPSCAARHPLRDHVRFFASGAEARAAGLRACKRCLPDDVARDEAAVLAAIDEIRSAEEVPTLEELGAIVGYSPAHFQRVFKRATGLSPAAYARALREERVREALGESERVTDAIYEGGYGSASRFYDQTKGRLGMTASDWRDGGRGRTIHWSVVGTSLGDMLVAATEKGVCCVSFGEGEAELQARFPRADLVEGGADFETLLAQVVEAVEAPGSDNSKIPLDVKGTAFQQGVWHTLATFRRRNPQLWRTCRSAGQFQGQPRGRRANCANNIAFHSLPPRGAGRRFTWRLCVWARDQGRTAETRKGLSR